MKNSLITITFLFSQIRSSIHKRNGTLRHTENFNKCKRVRISSRELTMLRLVGGVRENPLLSPSSESAKRKTIISFQIDHPSCNVLVTTEYFNDILPRKIAALGRLK